LGERRPCPPPEIKNRIEKKRWVFRGWKEKSWSRGDGKVSERGDPGMGRRKNGVRIAVGTRRK